MIGTAHRVAARVAAHVPQPRPHALYGGLTSLKDGFVDLRTASAGVIAASPANTAPELRRSNVNLKCSNGAQVNTGMPKIKLQLSHGRYRFSRRFVRAGVKETSPGSSDVKLTVTISGVVSSPKEISGSVAVSGTGGCALAHQRYTATLSKP